MTISRKYACLLIPMMLFASLGVCSHRAKLHRSRYSSYYHFCTTNDGFGALART